MSEFLTYITDFRPQLVSVLVTLGILEVVKTERLSVELFVASVHNDRGLAEVGLGQSATTLHDHNLSPDLVVERPIAELQEHFLNMVLQISVVF